MLTAVNDTLPTALDAPPLALPMGKIAVAVTSRIEDVEVPWRALTAAAIESPGQSYDFIRTWISQRQIPAENQCYVVGRIDGQPVALLPLHRKRVYGLPILTWFPGANVGCYAPVADYARLAALGPEGRRALWAAMTSALSGGAMLYMRSIPVTVGGYEGLFNELGKTLPVETLYRSQYISWEECDRLQRSKSRRKHDRQQGDRLNALGSVSFEEVRNGGDTRCAIETMFVQRSARFKAMGIRDTFVRDRLIGFYHDAAQPGSGIDVRLHVLRLDGAIVAVRYNVVHGDTMFCLISSMSEDAAIQSGSPGKQCLLRVMQTVFDSGISVFDMGSGLTDEKRHWCNIQTPLRQHYVGLTPSGAMIVAAHRSFQKLRARIKANKPLRDAIRSVRQAFEKVTGLRQQPPATEKSD